MSSVLYFVPNRTAITLDDARGLGLGYAFEQKPDARKVIGAGPDGQPGVVFADESRVERLGYHKDDQTWMKIPGSDAWAGYETKSPPGPEGLARTKMLAGHFVKLADGNQWLVPIARSIEPGADSLVYHCPLPRTIGLADDGSWSHDEVRPVYAELWSIAERWWDSVTQAGIGEVDGSTDTVEVAFDFDGVVDAALLALSTNYRVGRTEAAMLALFDDRNVGDVLNAVIDWVVVLDWLKKKQLDAEVPAG